MYDQAKVSIGGAASCLRKHEKAHLAGRDGSLHNGYYSVKDKFDDEINVIDETKNHIQDIAKPMTNVFLVRETPGLNN